MTIAVQSVAAYEREQQLIKGVKRRSVKPYVIDALIALGSRVSGEAKWLYVVVWQAKYHHAQKRWPTEAELAAVLGFSDRHIRTLLRELENAAMLTVHPGKRGSTNWYAFPHPNDWRPPVDTGSRASAAATLAPEQRMSGEQGDSPIATSNDQQPHSATAAATARGRSAETPATCDSADYTCRPDTNNQAGTVVPPDCDSSRNRSSAYTKPEQLFRLTAEA